jgi:hypothetical protein
MGAANVTVAIDVFQLLTVCLLLRLQQPQAKLPSILGLSLKTILRVGTIGIVGGLVSFALISALPQATDAQNTKVRTREVVLDACDIPRALDYLILVETLRLLCYVLCLMSSECFGHLGECVDPGG